jgi:hypothetical protein
MGTSIYKTAGGAERMNAAAGGLQWDGNQPTLINTWTVVAPDTAAAAALPARLLLVAVVVMLPAVASQ